MYKSDSIAPLFPVGLEEGFSGRQWDKAGRENPTSTLQWVRCWAKRLGSGVSETMS